MKNMKPSRISAHVLCAGYQTNLIPQVENVYLEYPQFTQRKPSHLYLGKKKKVCFQKIQSKKSEQINQLL